MCTGTNTCYCLTAVCSYQLFVLQTKSGYYITQVYYAYTPNPYIRVLCLYISLLLVSLYGSYHTISWYCYQLNPLSAQEQIDKENLLTLQIICTIGPTRGDTGNNYKLIISINTLIEDSKKLISKTKSLFRFFLQQ